MTNARRETWVALGFLAPNLIGFVLLSLGPIIFSLIISLTDWGGLKTPSFIGVDNYLRLLKDQVFLRAAGNTLLFTAMFVPLALVSAVGLALLFDRKVRGTSVVRLLCFMPIITDMISVSFIWTWIYHLRFGVLNYVLGLVGIPPQAWLGDARLALFSLVILSVWRWAGYYAVIILAALQGVPTPLQEAARIDGAGPWQVFEQMFVMTKGGPSDSTISIAMFLYQQGFLFLRMGYASSVAWVMFIGIFVFTFINWLLRRRWVYEE